MPPRQLGNTKKIPTERAIHDPHETTALAAREIRARAEIDTVKREYIIVEAANVFFEKGYHSSTIDDIASRLGVGKPHIYQFFKSKIDILSAVAGRGASEVYDAVMAEIESGGTNTEVLRRIAFSFTRIALLRRKYVAVYFREDLNLPEPVQEDINRKRAEIDRHIRKILKEGMKQGEFEEQDPYITSLSIAGMISYTFAWFNPNGKASVDDISEHISRQVLKLVSP